MRARAYRAGTKPPMGRRIIRFLPRLLFVLLVLGVIASVPIGAMAGFRYVKALPVFAVQDIEVIGLKYVRKADFISYMGSPAGQSLLDFDLDDASKKASGHPWVRTAVIRREFPHGLRFEVIERVPAAVALTGSGSFLIDTDGMAVAMLEGASGWEFLPRIEYDSAGGLKLVDAKTSGEFREALSLIRALHEEPSERLAGGQVFISKDGQPYLRHLGAVVRVGVGEYRDKLDRLADVSKDIERRGAHPSSIDLRFPGKVVVGDGLAAPEENKPETERG